METAKTLIVGASGQVGGVMMGVVGGGALGTSRVGREGWLRMDLADVRVAALDGVELDAVYCVGGMTHVDGCEAEPELAWRTHALGPGVLAAYARRRGVPFVYISTEYVFDGAMEDAGPYAEEARTHPLSVYGTTKLEGEQRVMEAHEGALVVRTTVVYGPDERRMNAVYGVMRNLAAGKRMRVPVDQITTPTYSRDLVGAAIGLVKAGERGVWHVAGPERMGRLAFAREVAQRMGLDAGLLEGVTTAELGQVARRPLDAGLATEKLRKAHPELKMRTVAESLEDCVEELGEFLGS